jgi:glycosyltransferase involved in cell wall biosynthesis
MGESRMKKVVIVNCFDTYEGRILLLREFFLNKGHDVTIIQSDFRHFAKVRRTDKREGFIFIESKPYYKNLSIRRLNSHYHFAKMAFEMVEKIQPNLIYVIPPNSLAKFASYYKRKHVNVKLIFDLIDLWPETMPIGKIKEIPPFTIWRLMRDNSLKFADFVVTECNLYQSILGNILKELRTKTVYLAKKDINVIASPRLSKDEIHLCYLGSINNIIDIEVIKKLIKSINIIKPTTLHIIGDGESRDILIYEIEAVGARVKYYGKVYDSNEKQNIFDECHFGLNVMKESVCVGLTMKSIDYFQHGLPILNNIKSDTTELVDKYDIGININRNNTEEVAKKVTSMSDSILLEMREKAHEIYKNYFSYNAFLKEMEEVIVEREK